MYGALPLRRTCDELLVDTICVHTLKGGERREVGQRRQARALVQTERGEGGEVAEPEGERASVAQHEGDSEGGRVNRGDDGDNTDGCCVCLHSHIYVASHK